MPTMQHPVNTGVTKSLQMQSPLPRQAKEVSDQVGIVQFNPDSAVETQ
jgi:hypothetical protein